MNILILVVSAIPVASYFFNIKSSFVLIIMILINFYIEIPIFKGFPD